MPLMGAAFATNCSSRRQTESYKPFTTHSPIGRLSNGPVTQRGTHYGASNDLFERMLDALMMYSCGYRQNGAQELAQSQIAKPDLIARKLELQPGIKTPGHWP